MDFLKKYEKEQTRRLSGNLRSSHGNLPEAEAPKTALPPTWSPSGQPSGFDPAEETQWNLRRRNPCNRK